MTTLTCLKTVVIKLVCQTLLESQNNMSIFKWPNNRHRINRPGLWHDFGVYGGMGNLCADHHNKELLPFYSKLYWIYRTLMILFWYALLTLIFTKKKRLFVKLTSAIIVLHKAMSIKNLIEVKNYFFYEILLTSYHINICIIK